MVGREACVPNKNIIKYCGVMRAVRTGCDGGTYLCPWRVTSVPVARGQRRGWKCAVCRGRDESGGWTMTVAFPSITE